MSKALAAQGSAEAITSSLRVLMVENHPLDVELCSQELKRAGLDVQVDRADSQEQFAALLAAKEYDIVISDYDIPGWSGAEALRLLKQSGKDIPFILVTGTLGIETAVGLMKEGVSDYILKDRFARLPLAVRGALAERDAREARRRAEEKYQRLAQAVESSSELIAMGDSEGTISFANQALLLALGYTEVELLGQRMAACVLSPNNPPELGEEIQKTISRKGSWAGECLYRRKEGGDFPVYLTKGQVKDAAGAVIGTFASAQDITEVKRMAEMFRQAQKMEVIGRLTGGIAHDFNNVLGVIIGYSEMLLDEIPNTSPLRKPVEEIKKAGDRASAMTRQLLAYSRQQTVERRVVNLNQIVVEMENMLRRMIGEDVEFRTVLDPMLGRVKADPGQIQQAIMNLAVNARDAMPKGGKLVLETANIELDDRYASDPFPLTAGPYILLTVTDTGVGMDAETQARIFEPFFTTKASGKGTGLGLSSVYGVVNQSGGQIRVYSEPGQGTAFKIYLPRVDENAQYVAKQGPGARSNGGSETVLLVEDEESLRSLTHQFLEQSGYHVLEASNGAGALEVVQAHRGSIHLLLTDVVMPGMSGPALAAILAPMHPEAKILYVSGYTGGFAVHNGLLDARMQLLQKPFSREAFLQKVRQTLDDIS